jgi:hypothetical protein
VNCREATELLGDHVDGSLGFIQWLRVWIHVWICQHCRNYFRSYKTTIRAEQAALGVASKELRDEMPIPKPLLESIVLAAKESRGGTTPKGSNRNPDEKS